MAAAALQKLGALWGRQLRSGGALASRLFSSPGVLSPSCIHTSASFDTSRKWEKKNKIVYPPQLPGEPRRPAEIYHCRRQIKYSKDKMWYLARLIRGMSIDQALAQLEFSDKKGAQIIKEVLLEAQDMAVRDHNVEFRSNLYVAESTSGRGQYLKRIRYHGRGRFGIMEKVPETHGEPADGAVKTGHTCRRQQCDLCVTQCKKQLQIKGLNVSLGTSGRNRDTSRPWYKQYFKSTSP
uniref:39S ribosomal protein L22, mitochondrial isoform X1 n=1 Tax=Jaculus jaculus TaxID=51337 RepID=UPI001E1B613E|nr:39S ribosomal protein L22, mitochondrial isoform X1 [Jaculus jaculus]